MTKQITPLELVQTTIAGKKEHFASILPKHVSPERFIAIAQAAIRKSPDLLECDKSSLYEAVEMSAKTGLAVDGKEAAIVKFGGKAQFMPMVAGLLKLVRNSGELKSITSGVIYDGDNFSYYTDETGPHLRHEPLLKGDPGPIVGAYALAITKDGGVYAEVCTEVELMAVKAVSKSKQGPWDGPFADEMRRKTAIRRLCKRLPMSTDLDAAFEAENDFYNLDSVPPRPEPRATSARLTRAIEDAHAEVAPPVTAEPEDRSKNAPI